jgi:hypothetical protein
MPSGVSIKDPGSIVYQSSANSKYSVQVCLAALFPGARSGDGLHSIAKFI